MDLLAEELAKLVHNAARVDVFDAAELAPLRDPRRLVHLQVRAGIPFLQHSF